jgi:uncharacterized delta-60 repeat protein
MKTVFTLSVIFLFLNVHAQTQNKAGTLDSSFGDSGKVISENLGGCYDMTVQADSKIVCGGNNHLLLQIVRYLPNGIIDSVFGDNGIAIPPVPETNLQTASIALQTDQKIVAATFGYKNGTPTIVLVRILPNGNIDNTFGTNGIVDSTFGVGESLPHIALQPDGKILVLGWYYPGFIVIRYNSDGSLDESFGDKGKVMTVFGAGTVPTAIGIASDGKLVTGGNYGGGVGYSKFLIARYTAEGTLDETFGNKGVATTDFGKYGDEIHNLQIQPDGKIIAAGVTGVRDIGDVENMAIARYSLNGSLDTTFGIEGKTTIVFSDVNSKANDLIIENNGKILLGGSTYQKLYYGDLDFVVSRLNPNGILDSSFGTNGITVTDFGSFDGAETMALQQNKIILAGENSINGDNPQINYALARHNNDLTQKQIIITKIRRWIQGHNGIMWNNVNGVRSYVIQRSYDGLHFNSITRINAGNTSNYTYADPSPLSSSNYYRLQTTSVDGAVAYSNVIAVTSDEDAIKISPNPAKNSLNIEGLSSNKTKLTVVDFAGNIKLQTIANNASSYNLNIALLKQGNYLLKIETNGDVVTRQFVKE